MIEWLLRHDCPYNPLSALQWGIDSNDINIVRKYAQGIKLPIGWYDIIKPDGTNIEIMKWLVENTTVKDLCTQPLEPHVRLELLIHAVRLDSVEMIEYLIKTVRTLEWTKLGLLLCNPLS